MHVNGSPSGTEFELKITADPVNTEPFDRPDPTPVLVMPCETHKTSCSSGARQDTRDAEPQEQEPIRKHMTKCAQREY